MSLIQMMKYLEHDCDLFIAGQDTQQALTSRDDRGYLQEGRRQPQRVDIVIIETTPGGVHVVN